MYECMVCGRRFPEGQGIVLDIGGKRLYFHSKRCAYNFLRSLIDKMDIASLSKPLNETIKEYKELRRRREERIKKKI